MCIFSFCWRRRMRVCLYLLFMLHCTLVAWDNFSHANQWVSYHYQILPHFLSANEFPCTAISASLSMQCFSYPCLFNLSRSSSVRGGLKEDAKRTWSLMSWDLFWSFKQMNFKNYWESLVYFALMTTFDIPLKASMLDTCVEDQHEWFSGMSKALCSDTSNNKQDRSATARFDVIAHIQNFKISWWKNIKKLKIHYKFKILHALRPECSSLSHLQMCYF